MTDTAPPQPRFGWKKAVIFSLLPIAAVLIVLEGAARVLEIWRPPLTADLGQGFTEDSRLFVPTRPPGRLMTHPRKTVAFNQQDFPLEKVPGVCRIFFLGGSSVNYLQPQLDSFAARIAAETPCSAVEFINCGGLSYGSGRLVLVAAEVLAYQPDLLVIYSGHNEFEELEQLHLASLDTLPLQRLIDSSAQLRFLRDRVATHALSEIEAERNRRILEQDKPDAARAWAHQFAEEEIRERMDIFRNNLTSILTLAHRQGVPVIIGTVPSNLVSPALGPEEYTAYEPVRAMLAEGRYEEAAREGPRILAGLPRHQSSAAENTIIREVAAEHGVPLADVWAAVAAAEPGGVPGQTLFSDHCHLNPKGNRILLETFAPHIIAALRGSPTTGE